MKLFKERTCASIQRVIYPAKRPLSFVRKRMLANHSRHFRLHLIANIFLFISSFLHVYLRKIAYTLFVFLKMLLLFLLGASLLLWTDLSASFFILARLFSHSLGEGNESVRSRHMDERSPPQSVRYSVDLALSYLFWPFYPPLLSYTNTPKPLYASPPRSVQHKNDPLSTPGRSKEKFVFCCP